MKTQTLYGLVGMPLGHSFSQKYFTAKFAAEHVNAAYLNFELSDIGEIMEVVAEYPRLRGFNVTTPYKRRILPYIDRLSDLAAKVGAVNTVKVVYPDGEDCPPLFYGYNTDAPGFAAQLSSLVTDAQRHAGGVLVLGSGGASAAVCQGALMEGFETLQVSRSPADAQIAYTDISRDILRRYRVVVNATPLGMAPHIGEYPPFPFGLLSDANLCIDLIYNPSPTPFMMRCAEHGACVADGLPMLRNQADMSWRIWHSADEG